MKMKWKAPPIVLVLILFLGASSAYSMVEMISFNEVVQNADVIFVGKAVDQKSRYAPGEDKLILTDVSFQVEKVIYANQVLSGNVVNLTFAGGRVGDLVNWVSDVPTIETGQTYVIFTRMDGKTHMSPVIGSFQGLFQVEKDEVSGVSYPVTYGGRQGIAGFDDPYIRVGVPVKAIRNGVVEERESAVPDRYFNVAPVQVGGAAAGAAPASASVSPPPKPEPGKILNLDEFIGEIQKRLADKRGVMQ